MFLWD